MKNKILVIDEGTTGTKALVFDSNFKVIGRGYQEFTQYTPSENMVEHDAEEIYDKSVEVCLSAIKDAGINSEDIKCVGITNQRNTCVLWDKNTGKPLHNAIVWQDCRTSIHVDALKNSDWYEKILNETGKIIAPHNDGLIIKWLMDNVPEIKEKIKSGNVLYGTMDTWLIWKLTQGQKHAVCYSNASSSGCIYIQKGEWHKEFLDYLGVPISIFPEIQSESGDYGVTEAFGNAIPITGAIADQQSALFAQGCIEPGTMKCTNGTGSFMDINIGTVCKITPGGVDNLIAWKLGEETHYAVEGFVSVTGAAVQWLRDGLKVIKNSADIEGLANSVTDTNGVYFVPALVGLTTPYNDPFARGMIIGLTRGTTEAHLARATLECIAFSIKDILDVVEKECGVKIQEMKIDGGASENNLLVQMMADYCDARVVRPDNLEATGLGAALMAALKMGMIKLEDVKYVLETDDVFEPKMDRQVRDNRLADWNEAVKRSMQWIKH